MSWQLSFEMKVSLHPKGERKRDFGKLIAGKEKPGIGAGARKGADAGVGCGFWIPAKQPCRFHCHGYDSPCPSCHNTPRCVAADHWPWKPSCPFRPNLRRQQAVL